MKRCLQCNRVETDDALTFCRADGTPLVRDSGSVGESGTSLLSSSQGMDGVETRILPPDIKQPGPATEEALSRPTAPRTVLDAGRALGGTRELGLPKVRRAGVIIGAVVLATALAAAGYLYFSRTTGAGAESIAVLPFVNASGDPSVEYLSDGISESLINSLSQLPNVRVMARSTMFSFKGKDADPRAIGKQLGVDAVLTGRVVQFGDSLTVQADLVNASDGSQLWGERYSRKSADLLAVQEDIAHEIVVKLRLRLSGKQRELVSKRYTENVEAYQLYLKGRYHWNRRTVEDFRKAIAYFQQAIERDPNYALAYSGLSDSYRLLAVYGGNLPRETMPQAREAALKALALDENLAEAHASLGSYTEQGLDWAGAEREYKRAIELNPNYATAHQWYGEILSSVGRHDEAIAELRRGVELDPLSRVINSSLGIGLHFAHRHDEALAQLKKTVDLDPSWPLAHRFLYHVYAAKAMYAEAAAEYLQWQTLAGDSPEEIQALRESFAKSGWRGFLQHRAAYLEEKSKREYIPADDVAEIYAQLGDKDKALAWLERAYQDRVQGLMDLRGAARFDNLRSDPRFVDLLRRIGFQQ